MDEMFEKYFAQLSNNGFSKDWDTVFIVSFLQEDIDDIRNNCPELEKTINAVLNTLKGRSCVYQLQHQC